MNYLETLSHQFNRHLAFREKRPGVTQLFVPLFHPDGDMVDIFLESSPMGEGFVRVTDAGATLMRLSYSYDIDSENKERIFQRILGEAQLRAEEGEIFLDAPLDALYPAILQFGQGIGKVSAMRLFKREVVQGLFYELVQEIVERDLGRYQPMARFYPIEGRDDLEVDYAIQLPTHPVFLFAVKDTTKARLAAISCLEFQRAGLRYRGVAVHENMEILPRKDVTRLTSALDKQFPNLKDFRDHVGAYLGREAS